MLADIKLQNRHVIISPYFKTKHSEKIGSSNFFYVKLKEEKDTIILRQVANQNGSIVVEQDAFMPLWFVLSATETSEYNALEYCNLFFESNLFQTAEPNLIFDNMLLSVKTNTCPTNDPYFGSQWNLLNIGQYGWSNYGIDIRACAAWQLSTGNGVKVAVIDQGIYLDHIEFMNNIDSLSYDCQKDTSPQNIIYGSHGTECAGIIGAMRNNNLMISGVAPNCRLMSISHSLEDALEMVLIQQHLARGINWAWQNGADIISNSWKLDTIISSYIVDAIGSAVSQGRDGKGCVFVFGTGNSNDSIENGMIKDYRYSLRYRDNKLTVVSCGREYVARKVYVTTTDITINQIFDFINLFDHEVEIITGKGYIWITFISDLPPDSLQYAVEYLKSKPYTFDGWSYVSGTLVGNKIQIRVPLFKMHTIVDYADLAYCDYAGP